LPVNLRAVASVAGASHGRFSGVVRPGATAPIPVCLRRCNMNGHVKDTARLRHAETGVVRLLPSRGEEAP